MISRKRILLLASASAITPLAIDLYLPAVPAISLALTANDNTVALTISIYMFGLILGQLVGGPLSDKYGRKNVMLFGTSVFVLTAVGLAFCANIDSFLILRVIQAIGGGFTIVTVPAFVRDHANGNDAARLLSSISFIMVLAPALAPAIGSGILLIANWQWLFVFLAMYGFVVCLGVAFGIKPEPRIKPKSDDKATKTLSWLRSYHAVLSNKSTLGNMVAQGAAFATMFTFIVNSSYMYQSYFGLTEFQFSVLFAANIVCMALFNRINVKGLLVTTPERMADHAIILLILMTISLLFVILLGASLYLVVPCIMLIVGVQGMINPTLSALTLKPHGERAGVASGAMGAMRFTLAGAISSISTLFQYNGILPMAIVMACSAGLAGVGYYAFRKYQVLEGE